MNATRPLFDLPPIAGFAEFWAIWPRKTKRSYAEKCWPRALRLGRAEDIIAGARAYAAKIVGDETKEQFIMHASTFLNQQCWTDYQTAPQVPRYDTRAWEDAGRNWLYNGKKGPSPKLEDFPRTPESP